MVLVCYLYGWCVHIMYVYRDGAINGAKHKRQKSIKCNNFKHEYKRRWKCKKKNKMKNIKVKFATKEFLSMVFPFLSWHSLYVVVILMDLNTYNIRFFLYIIWFWFQIENTKLINLFVKWKIWLCVSVVNQLRYNIGKKMNNRFSKLYTLHWMKFHWNFPLYCFVSFSACCKYTNKLCLR